MNAGFFGTLKAYYDANKITGLVDGNAVATWADLSGGGFDLTQGTAGAKPTFKTGIQNGLPVVRFDGTSDWMGTGAMFSASSDLSIFCVCKQSGGTTTDKALLTLKKAAVSQNGFVHLDLKTSLTSYYRAYQKADGGASGVSQNPILTFDQTKFQVIELILGSNMLFRINGELQDTDAITQCDFTVSGPAILQVGTYYTDVPAAFYLTGDIGELAIYSEALSTAKADLVSAYLRNKWGILK